MPSGLDITHDHEGPNHAGHRLGEELDMDAADLCINLESLLVNYTEILNTFANHAD
jgi:hypothetical protein